MRGDARAVFLVICGVGVLHILGFWINLGHWPFSAEGPGTALLKSMFGNDFDVAMLGDCLMHATLSTLFYPVALLAWTVWSAVEEEEDEVADENIKNENAEGDEPEIEIEE